MNQVYVKIRLRGNANKYRKVLSTEEEVYHFPEELSNLSCTYSPGAILDVGEWPEFGGLMVRLEYLYIIA